jgi:hypothetical protein
MQIKSTPNNQVYKRHNNCKTCNNNTTERLVIIKSRVNTNTTFKKATPLCENLEVYIFLRLDTRVVHNSR